MLQVGATKEKEEESLDATHIVWVTENVCK
jgi:hypothetical protein